MRTLIISGVLLLALTGCAQAAREHGADAAVGTSVASTMFDLSQTSIPSEHRENIQSAIMHVESSLADATLLARLQAKTDWRFAEPAITGDELARRIRERRNGQNALVRPPMQFYDPPYFGIDQCGGKSAGPFYRTSVTGCVKGGTILISLWHLEEDPLDTADFLAHEWMHAADYGHDGNSNQGSVEKRNSVPIHIGCLVAAHPDANHMSLCALSIRDANAALKRMEK